jgi:hypothetical protein
MNAQGKVKAQRQQEANLRLVKRSRNVFTLHHRRI